MFQSHKKLLLTLFIICFFFAQRGLVYGQGVTIDFSSFNSGGIQINTMSFGNTNNPSSQPTTLLPSTPMSPATITTNYTSSTTNKTSVNPNSISSFHNYNNNSLKNTITSFDTPELTKELIRPATFSPLSEKETLLPDAEPYIVTVCLSYNNASASGCSDNVTHEKVGEKLAGILLSRYFNGSEAMPFRVVMPSAMHTDQQKQLLHQIEIQAIAIIESRIFKADGIFIKEYNKIAREEADSGVNWSRITKNDKSTYEFHSKKAFAKLNIIAIQEKK